VTYESRARNRRGATLNAVVLFLAGLLNLWFYLFRGHRGSTLFVFVFCMVMGANWLRMGRKYYR
jgi:hypothetical protein